MVVRYNVRNMKNKRIKWILNFIKILKFSASKDTIEKVKRQHTEWNEIFANHISDTGHVSKIYKELLQLNSKKTIKFKMSKGDFPAGPVKVHWRVENPPSNAGDMDLILGPGWSHMPQSKWAHLPQLLSLSSRAHEWQLMSPHVAATEAWVPRACTLPASITTTMRSLHSAMKSSPCSPQLKKVCTQLQRSSAAKINKF